MRKFLELMKTPLIIPIIFVVLYYIVYVHTQLPKYDRKKIEAFDEIREEFYTLNSYILNEYDMVDADYINAVDGKNYFHRFYYYDRLEDENLPDGVKNAMKYLMDSFSYDNIYIEVSDTWIAYNVEGYDNYLFSKNGSYVQKEFENKTKNHFRWFVLNDGWYLLEFWAR